MINVDKDYIALMTKEENEQMAMTLAAFGHEVSLVYNIDQEGTKRALAAIAVDGVVYPRCYEMTDEVIIVYLDIEVGLEKKYVYEEFKAKSRNVFCYL